MTIYLWNIDTFSKDWHKTFIHLEWQKSTIVGYSEFQQVLILLNYVWRFEYKIPPAKKIEVSVPRCPTKICHHTLSVCLCPFSYRFIFHKPLIKQAGRYWSREKKALIVLFLLLHRQRLNRRQLLGIKIIVVTFIYISKEHDYIYNIVSNISFRFLCKIKMKYFPIFLLVFLYKYI